LTGHVLFHVKIAEDGLDSFPNLSLTLLRIVLLVGSSCIPNVNVLLAVRPLRVNQSVLKLYGVESRPTPASSGDVIVSTPKVDSNPELLLNVYVGSVLSYKYVPVAPVVTFPAWSAMRNLIFKVAVGLPIDAVQFVVLKVAVARVIPVVYAQVAPLNHVSLTVA
jgi:hypothetical protein